jgi:acyl-CoA thioesterase
MDQREELIAFFNAAPFAVLNGIVITEVREDLSAVVTMKIDDKLNAHGSVHGGAIFSVADHAFGVASNLDGRPKVGVTSQITYLSPATATDGPLVATATRVGEAGTTVAYQVTVSQKGRQIALFYGNAFLLKQGQ